MALTKKHFEYMAKWIATETAPNSDERQLAERYSKDLIREFGSPHFDMERFEAKVDQLSRKAHPNPCPTKNPLVEVGEDFEGIAYLVTELWEGAVEGEEIYASLDDARERAEQIAYGNMEAGDPGEVIVSEVYVSEDAIEATGYFTDEHYSPEDAGAGDNA